MAACSLWLSRSPHRPNLLPAGMPPCVSRGCARASPGQVCPGTVCIQAGTGHHAHTVQKGPLWVGCPSGREGFVSSSGLSHVGTNFLF